MRDINNQNLLQWWLRTVCFYLSINDQGLSTRHSEKHLAKCHCDSFFRKGS
ncbi:uncharacterized protein BP01DRAFT_162283 [Aspergillus saccharolyticus JOP 1030-1]|uniref:Uncharacterized protein n=1 Tax=Aspergillus saccharolyticus JOP 1030-1 TaxID=1450539 RepID=A0A318Z3S5_9EURO|nr:hypothetical protein BP01DRAFT_162283 [Aspergillus saccharolyticus JOP 1030-1]PYH41649.1 hypothetical protein BP01DRAFT_162283 [Aspergillus saccharolyticus JOP 1030-1]